jgi:hypothetical protein
MDLALVEKGMKDVRAPHTLTDVVSIAHTQTDVITRTRTHTFTHFPTYDLCPRCCVTLRTTSPD